MLPPAFLSPTMSAAPPSASKLFAAHCIDRPAAASIRAANGAAHIAWIEQNASQLEFVGPLFSAPDTPAIGTFLVWRGADSDTVETITAQMKENPLAKADVFADVEVRKWNCGIRTEFPLPNHLFLVWCVDKDGKMDLRKETRSSHLDWVKGAGRKGLVGPFPVEGGAVGSVLLVEGEGMDEIKNWVDTDPYNQAGLFDRVGIWAVERCLEDGVMLAHGK